MSEGKVWNSSTVIIISKSNHKTSTQTSTPNLLGVGERREVRKDPGEGKISTELKSK
jgi:hypothetical protein